MLVKMVNAGHIESDHRVIVISTAHGLKFPDFKVKYHQDQLKEFDIDPARRNVPIEVKAEYQSVRTVILKALEQSA